MYDTMANTILKELREFRTENNKRWEENDKRWEENDRRWEQNEKRWEENDRRWEENERRWEQNERRWEENERRWNENNNKWEENTKTLAGMNQRITALEEGRKKDRNEIIEVLDTMQKSIDNQFREMREYFDAKFEKVYEKERVFEKTLYAHEKRLNFHGSRLDNLEQWKEEFDMGEFTAV